MPLITASAHNSGAEHHVADRDGMRKTVAGLEKIA